MEKILIFLMFLSLSDGFLFGGTGCSCPPPPVCNPQPCCTPTVAAKAKAAKIESDVKPLDELELRAKLAGFNLDDPSKTNEESESQLKLLEQLGEENVAVENLEKKTLEKAKKSKTTRFSPSKKIETEMIRVDHSTTAAPEIVSAEETKSKDADQKCNSEELRQLIIENITENSSESKHKVNKAAEIKFGGTMDVICSRGHFSYVYSSNFYCEAAKGEVTCIAFRQSL
uniref:Ground-like domain-containing protein n=1 Tax=Panagrolaimus sp. JU765 TaxID=591449 RepID=A0AC34QY03_9BILA